MSKQYDIKKLLMDQVTDDYLNGDICTDSNSTFAFIQDLVSLLDEDAVKQFAKQYDYDLLDW